MTKQSQRDILRQFFSRCLKANFASGRRNLLSRKHRMFVVPAGVFLKHGRIPRSSDELAVAVHDVPALIQSPPRKFVIFVSHRWLTRKNPDDEHRTKYRRLCDILNQTLQTVLRQPRSLTGIRSGLCRFAGAWAALRGC